MTMCMCIYCIAYKLCFTWPEPNIKGGKSKRKLNLNLQKFKENPDPSKYNIETKLKSMKTQETGIKSSNEIKSVKIYTVQRSS